MTARKPKPGKPQPGSRQAPMVCTECHLPHATHLGYQACVGHSTRSKAGCRKPAVAGMTVCGTHGASQRSARAKSARVRAEAQATKVMRRFGAPIETTATEALLDTVRWTAGYVAWLRDKVAELRTDDALVWGKTRWKTGGEDRGTTYESKPNVWLVLLGEWQDRLVKVCAEAIKAGIEERRVRLAEGQGALVADVIKRVLADLDLTAKQLQAVPEVVPRHLRLLSGGA